MRPQLAGLVAVLGVIGLADLASVYVPGQILDGVYIRPHFVSAPDTGFGPWQDGHPTGDVEAEEAPRLEPEPEDRDTLSEAS